MNAIVENINAAGRAFIAFALPMLIQSGVLILALLAVDLILRRRGRAVFRYWIWMLVLVKLVLPPSLWSPVSVGTWLGERLEVPAVALQEPQCVTPVRATPPSLAQDILSASRPRFAAPPLPRDEYPVTYTPSLPEATDVPTAAASQPAPVAEPRPAVTALNWQGLVLLAWAAVAVGLLSLLLQRGFFVRGLVAQAEDAGTAMQEALNSCLLRIGVRKRVTLKLSPVASSPAVCGLIHPTILIPQSLASRLDSHALQAILLHELAHVKRGDLWVNLAQTLLQIVYFYNPLLWLANAMIRRTREQAVDETVLVAMGEAAPQYPETLLSIAKLAFRRRPALSLRLIGVVESKSALTARIKHMLTRPIPKTARLSLLGLLAIVLIAAVLLPMAKGNSLGGWFGTKVLVRFRSSDRSAVTHPVAERAGTYSRDYTATLRKGEKLAVVAELYQTGQPMRLLGCKTFQASDRPAKLSVALRRSPSNDDKTVIGHVIDVALGGESFRVDDIVVNTAHFFDSTELSFFTGSEIARKSHEGSPYVESANLLLFRASRPNGNPDTPPIWMPGVNVHLVQSDVYVLVIKALPLSQLDILRIDGPVWAEEQLPDGSRRSFLAGDDASRQAIAQEYRLNLRRALMRQRAPLPKLVAHRYYKEGDPIWISVPTRNSSGWGPQLDEIYHDGDVNPMFFLIDGQEYASRHGFGPFGGGGGTLTVPGELYVDAADFHLPPGRHTIAYGWKGVDVTDPNAPDKPIHFGRLATDPVQFEVVEEMPRDYYREVYREGWEDILRRSIETPFTDDWRTHGVAGALLTLRIGTLPFDIAFEVYLQAEGSDQQHHATQVAKLAGSIPTVMSCSYNIEGLNWNTVGDKRWRIILKPSIDVAKKHPPIREFYARELVTDWLSFERSPQFEQRRQARQERENDPQHYGGTIKADKPVDLDTLGRRWGGEGQAWPLPAGFELGWSPDNGGTLRVDPNSGVRLLWLPEANARLIRANDLTRQRLTDLPASQMTQIVPPKGEPTLIAILSSEGRVYFVTVSKVNETWANLSWWQDQDATRAVGGTSNGVNAPNGNAPFGKVVDTQGRPIAGAILEFEKWDPVERQSVKLPQVMTDADGRFAVPRIDSGGHMSLSIVAAGFATRDPVELGRREDGAYWPNDLTFTLRRTGVIEGTVLGPDGLSLPKAPLSLTTTRTDGGGVTSNDLRAITDESGHFRMDDVPPGIHLLYYPWSGPLAGEVDSGKWQAFQQPGERWPSAPAKGILGAVIVELDEGRQVTNVLIDLSKSTCVVEGQVRDTAAQLVGDATVDFYWKVTNGTLSASGPFQGEGYSSAVTDPNGRYRLVGLPPGDWHVSASHKQVRSRADLTPIHLAAGRTVRQDLQLAGRAAQNTAAQGRQVYLPDLEAGANGVLDLATGQLLSAEPMQRDEQYFARLGRGDIVYEHAQNKPGLLLLRGTRLQRATKAGLQVLTPDVTRDGFVAYFMENTPAKFEALTPEGRLYNITVLSADDKGCTLTYDPLPSDGGAGGGAPVEGGAEKAFSIYGTVTDESGRGMAGVEVRADCGWGTLLPTGQAVTDATGRYTLYFKRGYLSPRGVYPDNVVVQAATICARKDGLYEANLCRQGNLAMAGKPPEPDDRRRIAAFVGVVLPNKPHELNFVMRPAARIEGQLVDARGRPLPGRTLSLSGNELYPSSSVLATTKTDDAGKFTIESVPLKSFWFEHGTQPRVKSASVDFTTPGAWRIYLEYRDPFLGSPSLTIADVQEPAAQELKRSGTPNGTAWFAGSEATGQPERVLQDVIDAVQVGGVVTIPKGRYTMPVTITKPLVLRGASAEECVFTVTADRPAVSINTKGQGEVTIENVTVRWQLATSGKVEQPYALAVRDANVVIRNCRFEPLGNEQRSPVAVRIDGFSKATVDNCRFSGFGYTVCYGPGSEGVVQECILTDSGHQGVTGYENSTLGVARTIVIGSKYHGLRCTGGTMDVKDCLLADNRVSGIYLGNKDGRGTIANNVMLRNQTGVAGFYQSEYTVENNAILDSTAAGVGTWDTCRLTIRNNIFQGNAKALVVYPKGSRDTNVIGRNTFWRNAADTENCQRAADSILADPQLADPNRGDFTAAGAAKEQGHGLTDPKVIQQLWPRYEQAQRERPADTTTQNETTQPVPQAQAPALSSSVLAWQRTDRYVPPDPNGFFPDDAEGGKRLDALFQAGDKDRRSDAEILQTVRRGFRRTTQHRTLILAWIGNCYVWGKDPQNAEAVEILYHAVPMERHYAVYFGLSVLKNKTPNVLRTLADICTQGEEVGRITWGIGSQRDELLGYIKPYLEDTDPARRETASVLVKHFAGELDFEQWQRDRRLEQTKAVYGHELPQVKETLLAGDSTERRQALRTIQSHGLAPLLDDSFVSAIRAAAADGDARVRNDVVRLAGDHWVWSAQEQDPNAIALVLKLSSDSDREVRYNAVYYGLSTVRDKSEPVVRRLVEMALADHENNLYGRIVWGLNGPMKADPALVTRILAEHLDRAKSDVHHGASVYLLYRDVLGADPPADWPLAHVRQRYPADLIVVPFRPQEPFQPADADALWSAFVERLPAGTTVERLADVTGGLAGMACFAGVRGAEQAKAIYNLIQDDSRLRVSEFYPVLSWIQLHLEEQYAPAQAPTQRQERGGAAAPARASGEPAREPAASAQSLLPPETPGPIQQRIDAAEPGATIKLEPGVYKERLTINKPLTLEGAGWDKTVVMIEKENYPSIEEVQRIVMERVAKAQSDAERQRIAEEAKTEFAQKLSPVVLSVENAKSVVVRGIKFSSPGGHIKGASVSLPVVSIDRSNVNLRDCAVVAGPGTGIHIQDGSDVQIDRTLVAAVWGTGIGVTSQAEPTRAHIHDSDIRNCHYAGIRVAGGGAEAVIERCRISGAAWHGVRYDDVSPTLSGNLIFGNARSGIYASGKTTATVKNNLLYDNEMTGMSCWFQNRDVIEGNTFAGNERSGLEILGASKPVIARNIFHSNPTGVHLGDAAGKSPFAKSDGQVALEGNLFWANKDNVLWLKSPDAKQTIELDEKAARVADPQFTAPSAGDFSLPADSPARLKGIGATGLIPLQSLWPLQPEELAIIPKGDTRDSSQWRQ